ncbi:WYL domain-containing protein [Polaribacter sp. MED152]|uniref:WYL domain-containing protein n=1 Tax=Polaribacter sp. MED152 TaxID=313598 RepID=UPI000068C5EF|nr:WYL domain-containing protein [Polaribacter sp. MED152]EAQ42510.1 hypothetical protein MED152_07310 [Polaribacter sp. MED152]
MYVKAQVKKAIIDKRNIFIKYRKFDGDISERLVSDLDYNNSYTDDGFYNDHIKGFCHLRGEERTFRVSRITSITLL